LPLSLGTAIIGTQRVSNTGDWILHHIGALPREGIVDRRRGAGPAASGLYGTKVPGWRPAQRVQARIQGQICLGRHPKPSRPLPAPIIGISEANPLWVHRAYPRRAAKSEKRPALRPACRRPLVVGLAQSWRAHSRRAPLRRDGATVVSIMPPENRNAFCLDPGSF
jgi:hypothetical protein